MRESGAWNRSANERLAGAGFVMWTSITKERTSHQGIFFYLKEEKEMCTAQKRELGSASSLIRRQVKRE